MTKAKPVVIQAQPRDITVTGNFLHAMQQVTVLARQGYMVHPDVPMTVFQVNGTVSVPMTIGTPDQHFVNAAAELAQEAAERVYADYQKDVELAAARQIEAAARAKLEAERAALIAEQKAAIAKLEASINNL